MLVFKLVNRLLINYSDFHDVFFVYYRVRIIQILCKGNGFVGYMQKKVSRNDWKFEF